MEAVYRQWLSHNGTLNQDFSVTWLLEAADRSLRKLFARVLYFLINCTSLLNQPGAV